VEPHWIEVVHRSLPVANLPKELLGKKLIQLSDLHIGPQVDDGYLIRTMKMVEEMDPDIVVYTGDLVSNNAQLDDNVSEVLAHVAKGRIATCGILGNHDYGPSFQDQGFADQVISMAEAAGVRILRNESHVAEGLRVVGIDELWANQCRPRDAFSDLQADEPVVTLLHNPDGADIPGWNRYSGWVLSGHTHGGQCKPPFLPPPRLPVQNRRYTRGEFALSGNRMMYINRGVGYLFRVRFNARPEVTVFTLCAA
jgi:predicted MPP superfamily phosphohydrolase